MELNEEQKRAIRAAARERKRKQRARDQQKRIRALDAQQVAAERAERRTRNLHFFGEDTPGRNAASYGEELQIHREFLRALNQRYVQPGETLRSLAKRTFESWLIGPFTSRDGGQIYAPGFNRTIQKFDGEFGFVLDYASFERLWTPPKDCSGDEPIDVESLTKLPNTPKTPAKDQPTPEETTVPPPPAPAPVVPQPQPNAISFSWVTPHAHAYLTGNGGV